MIVRVPTHIRKVLSALAGLVGGLLASPLLAQAHVEFEQESAAVGRPFQAVVMVMHGCAGSPTVRLRMRLPAGVLAVVPHAKAGWTIETTESPYGRIWTKAGEPLSKGVTDIVWSGRLPPHEHGRFAVDLVIASELQAGTHLYFPTVQDCEKGVERWIDQSDDSEHPAPSLILKH